MQQDANICMSAHSGGAVWDRLSATFTRLRARWSLSPQRRGITSTMRCVADGISSGKTGSYCQSALCLVLPGLDRPVGLEKVVAEDLRDVCLSLNVPPLVTGTGEGKDVLGFDTLPDAEQDVPYAQRAVELTLHLEGGDAQLDIIGQHAQNQSVQGQDTPAQEQLGNAEPEGAQWPRAVPLLQERDEVDPVIAHRFCDERGTATVAGQAAVQYQTQE